MHFLLRATSQINDKGIKIRHSRNYVNLIVRKLTQMKYKEILLAFALVILMSLGACTPKGKLEPSDSVANVGFDMTNSDPAAIELVDSIMEAMGGVKNWNETRFISWNFYGNRDLVWDKTLGRVRIDSHKDTITYLVNINTLQGRVRFRGQEITETDSLQKMLKKAKSMWINDSYWLVMPFKLKDPGVRIKYLGEEKLSNGMQCNVLELTFTNVGDTPQNKFRLYVDLSDNLIKQWTYYSQSTQDSSNFVRPWDNYRQYGGILLSGDRSDAGGPRNVKVDEVLSDSVFTEF